MKEVTFNEKQVFSLGPAICMILGVALPSKRSPDTIRTDTEYRGWIDV